ncbi:MAG: histidinol-phosphate transaminase [Chloroflexi bacterium]|nr:histidinol-phosphate transaminase [Chloroflexota bacterium]
MHQKPGIARLPSMRNSARPASSPSVQARLSANENPLGPSPKALEAIAEALPHIHRYADPNNLQLRTALAAHLHLQPEHILCANGSDELILLTALAYINPGDEVIMADGTFISYYMRTQIMDAIQKRIPLVNGTHNLSAMADAITPNTKMILICNPNNPTGTTNGATEMQEFLARVPDDVLIMVDEAYVEYVTRNDFPDMLVEIRNGRKNMIILRTFAKIYGLAGLRLGYGVAHPDMLDYLNKVRPVFDVNALALVAGIAALEDHAHLQASLAHAAESRAFYQRELTALGLTPFASETNFVAVRVGEAGSDTAVMQAMAQYGVAINALGGWGLPGVIRISFGSPAENALCMHTLKTVLAQRS